MLHATGLSAEDLEKPQVGIASMWWEGNPCNMHLLDLAAEIAEGVREAGIVPMRFNTIGVSDGISMGTDGMSFSLPSRDLIADSIETVVSAQWYDGVITIPGCDKNMPGSLMAMARLNRPGLMVYGGTIAPGHLDGEPLDIVSAFEAYGQFIAGSIDRGAFRRCHPARMPRARSLRRDVHGQHDGERSRGTRDDAPLQFVDPCRRRSGRATSVTARGGAPAPAGEAYTPRDIMTRAAFENAMVLVTSSAAPRTRFFICWRSHTQQMCALTLDDFQAVSDRTPYLADLKPSGRYVMEDLDRVGGVPAVMRMLLDDALIDGSCLTVRAERSPRTSPTWSRWGRNRTSCGRSAIRSSLPDTCGSSGVRSLPTAR